MWIRVDPSRCHKILFIAMLSGAVAACAGRSRRPVWTQSEANEVLERAVDAPLPDQRRLAIERITRSRFVGEPLTVRAMDTIVRTDDSPVVRRAAARCLGASQRPEAWPALDAVLQAARSAGGAVKRPDVRLVAGVLDAADDLLRAGVRPQDETNVVQTVSVLLSDSPDREVRVRSARVLAYFPDERAVEVLVQALNQGDFAVAYEAEASLQALTGVSHRHNYAAWMSWLDETDHPLMASQGGQ